MKTMRRFRAAAAVCLVAGAVGCGGGGGREVTTPDPPKPGVLTLSLATPAADDRAIVVTVSGPGIGAVTAASTGFTVYTHPEAGAVRAAVFGLLASGPLLRFEVPDVRQVNAYSANVVEVASASNQLRTLGAGYGLTVGE